MIQSIRPIPVKPTNMHYADMRCIQLEIVDSDFGTCITAIDFPPIAYMYGRGIAEVIAIIKEYSSRNLDVASNIAIYLLSIQGFTYLLDCLIGCKECIPEYSRYSESVDKALLLC